MKELYWIIFICRPAPERKTRHGGLKLVLTTALGLYAGAAFSWTMAAWLEENELFRHIAVTS